MADDDLLSCVEWAALGLRGLHLGLPRLALLGGRCGDDGRACRIAAWSAASGRRGAGTLGGPARILLRHPFGGGGSARIGRGRPGSRQPDQGAEIPRAGARAVRRRAAPRWRVRHDRHTDASAACRARRSMAGRGQRRRLRQDRSPACLARRLQGLCRSRRGSARRRRAGWRRSRAWLRRIWLFSSRFQTSSPARTPIVIRKTSRGGPCSFEQRRRLSAPAVASTSGPPIGPQSSAASVTPASTSSSISSGGLSTRRSTIRS